MLSYEPELERLRPHLGERVTDALITRERREVFSVYPEVRLAAWAGALLLASAVGLFVKNHFELFDRAFLAAVLGAMAAACYIWAARARPGVVSDYILLLGALLLSADVGFIEQQFDVFGEAGVQHFLLLAVVHAVTAYRFHSRLVLSLSITALAAWMGIERQGTDLSMRAFACAGLVLVWRAIHVRRAAALQAFARVFEHFAANLALWGGLLLLDSHAFAAALVTSVIAAAVITWGFRTRVEAFVLYGFVYAVIANIGYAMKVVDDELALLVGILIAVPALVVIHRRFRSYRA